MNVPQNHTTPRRYLPKGFVLRLKLACLVGLIAAHSGFAQANSGSAANTITLLSDTPTAPVATVVHFSATVVGGLGVPTGNITFFDNGDTIATVPLEKSGTAALGVASFQAGPHPITAVYNGDATYAANTSSAIQVLITPLQPSLGLTTSRAKSLTALPIVLTATGLPAAATGTVTFADNGITIASTPILGAAIPAYLALGASIAYGAQLEDSLHDRYPALYAASLGLTLTDLSVSGYTACSVLSLEILPNHVGPTQASAPLVSLEVGTSDAGARGLASFETVESLCDQANLAWLAIPREYKVLASSPQVTLPSSSWSYTGSLSDGTVQTAFNNTGSGTATLPITTSGGPIYLWYLLQPLDPTNFAVSIDGTVAQTVDSPAPGVFEATGTGGFALLRLPIASGPHSVTVTALGGTVGVLGVATPPSPGAASVHPIVLAADIGSLDTNVALLASDGLDIRRVPTHAFLTDADYPNPLGDRLVLQGFQAATAGIDVRTLTSFVNAAPSATVTFHSAGTHTLTATYSGDTTYGAAQSTATQETVLLSPTLTTLSAPSTSAFAGTLITLRAAVNAAAATGNITFLDGATSLQQVQLTAGSAAFSLATLSPGAHRLSASYAGDSAFLPSQSPALTLQINPNQTTVTLSALPATLAYGSAATLTATLAPSTATGAIQLLDTFTAPGQPATRVTRATTAVSSGTATFGLATLPVGTHVLSAFYAGDADDLAAASPAATLAITALPTTTTLSPLAGPTTYGAPLTLTATTTPAATGKVTFADALTTSTYPGTLLAGVATITLTTLVPGTHPFTATFTGDATHTASTSPAVSVIITPVSATVSIGPLPASLAYGTPLTLIVSTTPASATGTVLFRDTKLGILGQATLTNGSATLTLPTPSAGPYAITALYSGDTFDTSATSPVALLTIVAKPTTLVLQPMPATRGFGVPLTLIAQLLPAAASGVITFADASGTLASAPMLNGVATATLSTLASGPHAITANYAGDGQYAAATSASGSITITPNPTAVTLTLSQTAVPAGVPALFTATVVASGSVTPSGTVTLRTGSTSLASGPATGAGPGLGYATLSVDTTGLSLGTYAVTAFYSGDRQNLAANSSTVTLTILPVPVTLAVSLSAQQIVAQAPVTVTATVVATPGSGIPTGSIVFASNGAPFATIALTSSAPNMASASTTLSKLAIGIYAITATYKPSGIFAPAAAPATASLNVTAPFTLTLSPSTISAPAGTTQTVGLTLTPVSSVTGTLSTRCTSPVVSLMCTIAAPTSLNGSAPVAGTITITSLKATTAAVEPTPPHRLPLALAALLLPLVLARRRRHLAPRSPLLTLVALFLLAGCGGTTSFPSNTVAAGTQVVTVSASVNGTSVSTSLLVQISK
jgi:hypothetical protein